MFQSSWLKIVGGPGMWFHITGNSTINTSVHLPASNSPYQKLGFQFLQHCQIICSKYRKILYRNIKFCTWACKMKWTYKLRTVNHTQLMKKILHQWPWHFSCPVNHVRKLAQCQVSNKSNPKMWKLCFLPHSL